MLDFYVRKSGTSVHRADSLTEKFSRVKWSETLSCFTQSRWLTGMKLRTAMHLFCM